MELKFYLNKFLKADNIENYTLKSLQQLKSNYEKFLEDTEGVDPDFPLINFGNKGKKIEGKNIYSALKDNESLEDFKLNKMKGLGLNESNNNFSGLKDDPSQMRKLTRQAREGQKKSFKSNN